MKDLQDFERSLWTTNKLPFPLSTASLDFLYVEFLLTDKIPCYALYQLEFISDEEYGKMILEGGHEQELRKLSNEFSRLQLVGALPEKYYRHNLNTSPTYKTLCEIKNSFDNFECGYYEEADNIVIDLVPRLPCQALAVDATRFILETKGNTQHEIQIVFHGPVPSETKKEYEFQKRTLDRRLRGLVPALDPAHLSMENKSKKSVAAQIPHWAPKTESKRNEYIKIGSDYSLEMEHSSEAKAARDIKKRYGIDDKTFKRAIRFYKYVMQGES